jgi:hypothetical protein
MAGQSLIAYLPSLWYSFGMIEQTFRAIAIASAAKAINTGEGVNKLLADAAHLERYIITGRAPEERETAEITRYMAGSGTQSDPPQ